MEVARIPALLSCNECRACQICLSPSMGGKFLNHCKQILADKSTKLCAERKKQSCALLQATKTTISSSWKSEFLPNYRLQSKGINKVTVYNPQNIFTCMPLVWTNQLNELRLGNISVIFSKFQLQKDIWIIINTTLSSRSPISLPFFVAIY